MHFVWTEPAIEDVECVTWPRGGSALTQHIAHKFVGADLLFRSARCAITHRAARAFGSGKFVLFCGKTVSFTGASALNS